MGWTRTGTEVLHQGPFVSLLRDRVVRPDGSSGVYEYIEVGDGVRVVALDAHANVLLVADNFCLQQRRMLHLPGGGVESQTPADAALRELEEEVGFVASKLDPLGVIEPLPATTTARVHLFLATDLRPGKMGREPTEAAMTVHRRTLGQASAAVQAGQITDAGSVTGILLAALARPDLASQR